MLRIILIVCFFIIGCDKKKEEIKEVAEQPSLNAPLGTSNSDVTNSDTLWVDNVNSNIQWIGRKFTGEHSGRVKVAGGYIVKDGNQLTGGEILINMNSITVDDIENPRSNQSLVDHLKDDDFFNVEKYPTAKFVFNDFKGKDDNTSVSGIMTIRDKSVQTNFLLNVVVDSDSSYTTGTVNIDRSKFGIKYKSKSFFSDLGDRFIYDEFTLNFKILAR